MTCPAAEASDAAMTAIIAQLSGDDARADMATVLVATHPEPLLLALALLNHACGIAKAFAATCGVEPAALAEAMRAVHGHGTG